LVVLALVGAGAGVATAMLIHHNKSGTGGSSPGALPPTTLLITSAINQPTNGPLPAGYNYYAKQASGDQSAGFRLAAPANWTASVSGDQIHLRDPSSTAYILVDLTRHTFPNDMVKEARFIETRSGFPGYQRINLNATNVRGTAGAVWKFTWNDGGVQQEAVDLLFVMQTSAGPQSYALYMTAPKSTFDRMRPTFDEAAETFVPLPR
jgi:hypothetical protein